MKTKLMLLSLVLASFAMSASAQSTREKYTSNGADNIFISATGGISTVYSGKHEGKFGKIAPHITVSLGKWFNPVLGLRLQGGLWRANFDTKHSFGNLNANGEYLANDQKYHKNIGIIRLDGMYNLTNAILGYNPDRLFTLSVFAGPGLTFSKSHIGDYESDGATTYKRVIANGDSKEKITSHINGSVG